MGICDAAPDDYCGFMLEPEDVDENWIIDGFEQEMREAWDRDTHKACCLRKPEYEGLCVWHADIEKDVEELVTARLKPTDLEAQGLKPAGVAWDTNHLREHLSGAILRDMEFPDGFSFERCVLVGADFSGASLNRAKFSGAGLLRAQFPEADLEQAQFQEAVLEQAYFRETDLVDAQFLKADLSFALFPEANLWRAEFPLTLLTGGWFQDAHLSEGWFPEAYLAGATFPRADLVFAQFPEADLSGAEFPEADLSGAEFPEADLSGAEFSDADLQGTTFPPACVRQNAFISEDAPTNDPLGASLEDAQFEDNTDLRGADLSGARLYQTAFTDVRINDETRFGLGDESRYGEKCRYEYDPNTGVSMNEDVSRLEAAAWTYRRLESLFEANAMDERARNAHIRKEEAQREHLRELTLGADSWRERTTGVGKYIVKTLNWYLHRHGESLYQPIKVSVIIILICGIAYAMGGITRGTPPEAYFIITSPSEFLRPEAYIDLLNALYFSFSTFISVGYGDYSPTGPVLLSLAGFQSLFGALIIALFVFVLGRRVSR